MPQLTDCPSCAERLDPEDRFCGNCGFPLAEPAPGAPDAPAAPAVSVPAQPGERRSAGDGGDGPGDGDYGLAPPSPVRDPLGVTSRTVPKEAATAAAPVPRSGLADPRETLREPREPEPAAAAAPSTPAAAAAPARPAPGACPACGSDAVADGHCQSCGHAQPRPRDHIERELAGVAAITDRGLRHRRNEDFFDVCETSLPDGTAAAIAVVCDGVSSSSRPDDASEAACLAAGAALRSALSTGADPRQAMRGALDAAASAVNALVQGEVDAKVNAPACTIVSATTTGELLTVGWVGDSRAYWIPDDRDAERPSRLTEDDSWASMMVQAGLLSEAEAYADARAHAITGWLGADAVGLDPHTAAFEPDSPGVVVVCSDGLWNYAESAEEMAAAVPADARTHPLRCAHGLVRLALDGGGHDNITVAVIPFPSRLPSELPDAETSADSATDLCE